MGVITQVSSLEVMGLHNPRLVNGRQHSADGGRCLLVGRKSVNSGTEAVQAKVFLLSSAEKYFAESLSAETKALLALVNFSCSAEGVEDAGLVKRAPKSLEQKMAEMEPSNHWIRSASD